MDGGAWVTLTGIENEFCEWMAAAICARRKQTGSKHVNNWRGDDARALAQHVLAARTECAAKTFFWMTEWRIEIVDDPTRLPDLVHVRATIDVKGVDLHSKRLIFPLGKVINHEWAYVLVSAQDHPRHWIRGWCWGEYLAKAPVRELEKGRPCHVVELHELLPPEELRKLLLG